MIEQICFIFENKRYVTLFNASEFLSKAKPTPEANYAEVSTLLMNPGYVSEFKKIYGTTLHDIPNVTSDNIQKTGNFFTFDGTANIDGVTYNVSVSAGAIHFSGGDLEEDVAGKPMEEAVEETAAEPEPEPEVVKEAVEEPEPDPEPVVVPENVEDSTSEPKAEPVTKAMPEPSPSMSVGYQEETYLRNELIYKEVASNAKSVIKPDKPVGIGMIFGKASSSTSFKLGTLHRNNGCYIGGEPDNNVIIKKQPIEKKKITEPDEMPVMCEPAPEPTSKVYKPIEQVESIPMPEVEEPSPVVKRVQKYTKPKASMSMREALNIEAVPQEAPVVVEDIKPFYGAEEKKHKASNNDLFSAYEATQIKDSADFEQTKSSSALKEAVIKELPPEAVGVIDKIPKMLFGDIIEFTGRNVDLDALKSMGNNYCINNKWHKEDSDWFAIDVVPNSSRFFFNKNANVAVEIPIMQVRAWNKAVTV